MKSENNKSLNFYNIKKNYKPDILTCLANLSSDEVFTSPGLANEILDILPQELFSDKNAKFLDPAVKSGVFLREIAARLMVGLEKEIPNPQERRNHIFNKQLYGIAITELTAQMSRRSVYCSKTANGKYSICSDFKDPSGNIYFNNIQHTFKNGICLYCGASENEYGIQERINLENHAYEFIHLTIEQIKEMRNMKFDVIIGNPPYQISTAQDSSQAIPLYHKFVEQAKKLNPRFLTMIIPSRWLIGGMKLEEFRKSMLNDNRIRILHDFEDAGECFSGVEIKGGVCYFLWDRDNVGMCDVYEHKGQDVIFSKRTLIENGMDVFIRKSEAISIFKKVNCFHEESFSKICSAMKPFGVGTAFKDFSDNGDIKIFANKKQAFVNKKFITKNFDYINKWKLFIPKAVGIGNVRVDWVKPIIGGPGTCCTETYILIGPFANELIASNVFSYTQTKFFHLFLSFRKITQDLLQKTYTCIPMQDFSETWSDEKLFKKYNLTYKEIEYIENLIRPMDLKEIKDE